ncbi:MAG TPA: hypothetical protein VF728_07090 [Nocardioides sp.]
MNDKGSTTPGESIMWDTIQDQESRQTVHLTHDLPCPECGHGPHSFLPCSDTCTCRRRAHFSV